MAAAPDAATDAGKCSAHSALLPHAQRGTFCHGPSVCWLPVQPGMEWAKNKRSLLVGHGTMGMVFGVPCSSQGSKAQLAPRLWLRPERRSMEAQWQRCRTRTVCSQLGTCSVRLFRTAEVERWGCSSGSRLLFSAPCILDANGTGRVLLLDDASMPTFGKRKGSSVRLRNNRPVPRGWMETSAVAITESEEDASTGPVSSCSSANAAVFAAGDFVERYDILLQKCCLKRQ